jgi:CRISPR-associated protein Cmr2
MADPSNSDRAFLSFFLGPVQPFIEAARTIRDLWTGSYLLAWLTASAMEPVLALVDRGEAERITPDVTSNALVDAVRRRNHDKDQVTIASIPNKFAAEVPADRANALAQECADRCREEWNRICDAVRDALNPVFRERDSHWDWNWPAQVESYLEIRTFTLPLAQCSAADLDRLGVSENQNVWTRQMDLLGTLRDVSRAVRHTPDYHFRPRPDAGGRCPAKCSLLGSFEQMGPADLDESRKFWEALARPTWPGFHGTSLRKSDRLCAISLVKRFAWAAYFANPTKPRLGLQPDDLPYPDTATVAAARWLPRPEEIPDGPPEGEPEIQAEPPLDWHRLRRWSGQWLHWIRRDQEEDERPCPRRVWEWIEARKQRHGRPPTYYAFLVLDADDMGKVFRGERGDPNWGQGAARYKEITKRLTRFALAVREVVEKHHGVLVYSGGDDVLALVPVDEVVACARELRDLYRSPEHLGDQVTTSAGIAVVHIKEDLRFALRTVREAERRAKRFGDGSKNALGLTVCRRSGEHSRTLLAWPHTEPFTQLVAAFRAGASDRWAYKLRSELPALCGLPWPFCTTEVNRLLGRAEGIPDHLPGTVKQFMQVYYDEMVIGRGREGAESLEDFVKLCQAASFLARGRD